MFLAPSSRLEVEEARVSLTVESTLPPSYIPGPASTHTVVGLTKLPKLVSNLQSSCRDLWSIWDYSHLPLSIPCLSLWTPSQPLVRVLGNTDFGHFPATAFWGNSSWISGRLKANVGTRRICQAWWCLHVIREAKIRGSRVQASLTQRLGHTHTKKKQRESSGMKRNIIEW